MSAAFDALDRAHREEVETYRSEIERLQAEVERLTPLVSFAEDVLNYLEADDDWGPDTLEFIKGRADRYGLAGPGPDGLFIRKNHYRGREDDAGWTYWADAESGGWVVVRYGGIGPAEPASDVLYADWAAADAAARAMATEG